MARLSWDEYFLEILEAVARRSTCDRGRSAAVLVRDRQILSTGYVGAPSGQPHCDEIGHLMIKMADENGQISEHCIRTSHAEANAIALAAKRGIALEGATLYTRLTPCFTCAKMLVTAGIRRVVAQKRYQRDQLSLELLQSAGLEIVVFSEEIEDYK